MHIAVLVYGRLNKCVEHYQNIIESIGKENQIDFFLSSDYSDSLLLQHFIDLYKPKLFINDSIQYDYDLTKYPNKRNETNIHTMICHFINKNRVFLLLEKYMDQEKICYDCVLSLRIDVLFQNHFVFYPLSENTIYIPFGNDYLQNAINDQIAYGKVDVMRKYNSIICHTIYFLEHKLSIPHPESLHYANIHFHKLYVERVHLVYCLDK